MNNKKILLEFLPSVTYLTGDAQYLDYHEFVEAVNGTVWNVDVSDEIEYSKNLTDNNKQIINSFLSSIHDYFYELQNDISKNTLESLDDEINNLFDYCKDENIEIIDFIDEDDANDANDANDHK